MIDKDLLEAMERESLNFMRLCETANIPRHPDFVKSLDKMKGLAENNLALISEIRRLQSNEKKLREIIYRHADYLESPNLKAIEVANDAMKAFQRMAKIVLEETKE